MNNENINIYEGNTIQQNPYNKLSNDRAGLLLIVSLVTGIVYNTLFFKKDIGVSFFIFIIYSLVIFTFVTYKINKANFYKRVNDKKIWILFILISILLLSARLFISSNDVFNFFCVITVIGLSITYCGIISGQLHQVFEDINWVGYVIKSIFEPIGFIFKPFMYIGEILKSKKKNNNEKANNKSKKIFIGVLISVPILLIIIPLLASADYVFSNYFENMWEWLDKLFLKQSIKDIFNYTLLFVVIFIFSFGFKYMFFRNKEENKMTNYKIEKTKISFDGTIFLTILVLVNIVYIVFCFVQFKYLFSQNTLPEELSYAQYARKGFAELVFVSIINYSLLMLSIICTKDLKRLGHIIRKILLVVLSIATFIMIYSSYYRMNLYENYYGFTRLRLIVYTFLLYEAIMIFLTLTYIIIGKVKLFKTAVVLAIIMFTTLNYINVDKLIVNENIKRYSETNKIDLDYLLTLSYDSLPQIIEAKDDFDDDSKQRIDEYTDRLRKYTFIKNKSWQGYKISYKRVNIILKH